MFMVLASLKKPHQDQIPLFLFVFMHWFIVVNTRPLSLVDESVGCVLEINF